MELGMKNIIVVESPIKAKTIQKYLDEVRKGSYTVVASGGHIKDLPSKTFSVEINKNEIISGHYEILSQAKPFIKKLKNLLIDANDIFICTDDDREGEKICEDIIETLKIKTYFRYAPREIIKSTIVNAIVNKVGIRQIDEKIIEAQRVRRLEDRIYGYGLSPVIRWYASQNDTPVKTHGTGRVEAIALDILYERHKAIIKYNEETPVPKDIVKADYKFNGIPFELKGDKLEFEKNEEEELEKSIRIARENPHVVYSITPDIGDYSPPPPFITSSMYSVASYRYGFEPDYTKKLAQELFYSGAINYPRTDSYTLSNDIVNDIIAYLKETINIEHHNDILNTKRKYKNKKGAQAAHEAIRPTIINIKNSPSYVMNTWRYDTKTARLKEDHFKLYELIWVHTVTTQLIDSQYDETEIIVRAGSLTFSDKAFFPINKGWEQYSGLILNESKREDKDKWRNREKVFPKGLRPGLELTHVTINTREKKSIKPRRISAGSLISILENLQVARPSTMHTISSKIIKKGYAKSDNTLFTLTNNGVFVAEFNSQFAPELINRKNATKFENTLQKIEEGTIEDTNEILKECWAYIDIVKGRVKFVDKKDREATKAQKETATKIYNSLSEEEKRNVNLQNFDNFEKASKFISSHKEKEKKQALTNAVGICPKCKNNSIVNKEKTFSCLTNKCSFVLFKNGLVKFFQSMKKDFDDKEIIAIVTTLLKDNVVFVSGLQTQYGNKDSYFELVYSKKYKSYSLAFLKKGQEVDAKLGIWENNLTNISAPVQSPTLVQKELSPKEKDVQALNHKIQQLEQDNKRLIDENTKDSLTRANNRKTLNDNLQKIINARNIPKINNMISVAFFDVDNFKRVNDTFGHKCGDEVLIALTDISYSAIRHYSINGNVYRLGGDEFVLVFYGHSPLLVEKLLNVIRKSIASKIFCEKTSISISIGFANFIHGDDVESLCDKADQALYLAKNNGKNSVEEYKNTVEEF